MKKNIVVFGASSKIASEIVLLLSKEYDEIILIGRSKNKIESLKRKIIKNNSNVKNVDHLFTPLNSSDEIKKSFKWLTKKLNSPSMVFVCPAFLFKDNEHISSKSYIEALNVNAILPIMVCDFYSSTNAKIITLGSLFSIIPRKNNYFYSYSKKIFHTYFKNMDLVEQKEKNYLFLLGPVNTPMYVGHKSFYVSSPIKIAQKIVRTVSRKNSGMYILPKAWTFFLPLIYFYFIFR